MNKRGSVFLNSEKLKCSSRRYSFLISIVSESSWCSEFSASYCYIHSFSLSVVFTLSLQYRQACGKANYLSSCFVVIIAVSIGKKKSQQLVFESSCSLNSESRFPSLRECMCMYLHTEQRIQQMLLTKGIGCIKVYRFYPLRVNMPPACSSIMFA